MKPQRESDGARTPMKRLNGSSRSATCANKQQACLVHTSRRSNNEASGSIYAEKKTLFGATEEGGVKALVYELGTGKANGERIEERSPWMSAPTYKEAMVRQRQFMPAHEYLHPPIRKRAKAASSSSQSTAGESTSESRPKRASAPASHMMGSPLRL